MDPREYRVTFTEVAVTAAVDLFEIRPADDKPIAIYGFFLGQSTEFGDAAAELLPYRVIRGFTTSGTGGATPTPTPASKNSGEAAGFGADTNNTTVATTGTTVDLHADTFHVATGEKLWLPEGAEWDCSQADTSIVIRLASAPVDSIDFSGTLYVREFG